MAWVDRHHRRPNGDILNCRPDHCGQTDCVIVQLLAQPQLRHAGVMGGPRRVQRVVDKVGNAAVGRDQHSCRHDHAALSWK
jgi:hypothetical protein